MQTNKQGQLVLRGGEAHQWSEDKGTQEFLQWLRQSVATCQESWLAGEYISHDANVAAQAVAQAMARIIYEIENIEIGEKNEE